MQHIKRSSEAITRGSVFPSMIEKGKTSRTLFALGSLSAGVAVAAGAFGAHALKAHLSTEMLQVFDTSVRYHMYHSLALLATAWAFTQTTPERSSGLVTAAWLFVVGTALFSGSLYLLSLTGLARFGAVTPFGGVALLAAWGILARTMWKSR